MTRQCMDDEASSWVMRVEVDQMELLPRVHQSSSCQNPSQEGSCMTCTSQEYTPLAIGRLGTGASEGGGGWKQTMLT
jgi:hypothetical protein